MLLLVFDTPGQSWGDHFAALFRGVVSRHNILLKVAVLIVILVELLIEKLIEFLHAATEHFLQ